MIEIGALKKAKLLKSAFENVNIENNTDAVFRSRLLNKEIQPLFIDDDLFDPLNRLDIEYYASEEEDIEQLLGDYLCRK